MLGRLVTIAAALAAGYALAQARREAQGGEGSRMRTMPEPLQRWEDEGGAVPAGGARTVAGDVSPSTSQSEALDASRRESGTSASPTTVPGSVTSPMTTLADTPTGRDASQLGDAPL